MAIKSFLSEGGFSVGSVGSTPIEVIDGSGNITAGTISGSNLTLSGNLTVNGSTITINSTTITADDVILTLGGDTAPSSDDNKDRGIEFRWHNGTQAKVGFFGFDDSTGYFTFIPDATNTSEVFAGTQGDIQVSNLRSSNVITTGDVSANTVTAGGAYTTRITGTGSGAYIYFGTSGGSSLGQIGRFGSLMQFDSDTPFAFRYQGTDLVRIGTGGNVGIGTIAPASKLTVGPNFITSSGVTIDTNSAGDSQLVARKAASKTAFSVLAWDSASYIGSGTYYNSSAWVHHNSSNNSQLFILNPGTGLSWYASSDATVSWNVANNVTLWNDAGNWKSLVQSTASGNSFFTGGNLGVGTSSPAAPLEVVGTTSTAIFRNSTANSYGGIRIYNDQNSNSRALEIDYSGSTYASALVTNGPTGESAAIATTGAYPLVLATSNTARLTILSGGNVGIGTITPTQKLDVAGHVASTSSGGNPNFRAVDGSIITKLQSQSVGDTTGAIGTESNHTLKLITNNATRVTLDTSGNVGIGTSSPTAKLDVYGGASPTSATNIYARAGSFTTVLGAQDSPGVAQEAFVGTITNNDFKFKANNAEYMRLTAAGNVGIGTATPAGALDVVHGTTTPIYFRRENNDNQNIQFVQDAGGGWIKQGGTVAKPFNIGNFTNGDTAIYSNSIERIRIVSGGNVGIGTSSPQYNLEISGAAATNGVVRIGSIDYGSSTVLSVAPGVINFDAAGVVGGRFKINSSGKVGINNTTPTYTLDVGGPVRTNDWFYVDGSGYGIYNNANSLYFSSNNATAWNISSASGQSAAGLRLYSGGHVTTFRGHFYGDSNGQGFLQSGGGWGLLLDTNSNLKVYGGVFNTDSGIRILNPGGAAYSTNTATVTGAWKIKLPTDRYKSQTMMRMTVKIYQYNTGTSYEFEIGGYNYSDASANWYNVFAEQKTDAVTSPLTIRFGNDGASNCIWIGETNTAWSYPQVFVTEFQGGFSGTTAGWATAWSITAVTAFDTVTQSRTASQVVTSNNISTLGVSSITGTSNQVIASASTGAVTLSLPQSIHTGATPTFSTLTLSGDVLTFSGSGVSAYNTSTARIYNQAGVGPTINGAQFQVRTGSSGTLGFSVDGSQNATVAGNLTVSGTGDSTIAGTLGIGGAAYYSNKLTVDGSALAIGLGVTNVRGGHVTTITNPDGGSTSTNIAFRVKNSSGTTLLESTYGGNLTIAGNTGIGVAPAAWDSGYNVLQLGSMFKGSFGVRSINTTPYSQTYITSNAYRSADSSTDTTGWTANNGHYASALLLNGDGGSTFKFLQAGWTTGGSAITWTQSMTLDSNGNLGVGTASPSYRLHVSGNALVSKLFISTANASYDLYNNGTTYLNGAVNTGGGLTVGTTLTVSGTGTHTFGGNIELGNPSTTDPRLKIFRSVGGNEWLQIAAHNGGSLGNNQYSFDLVHGTAARPFYFRRSTDAGSTYSNFLSFDASNNATFAANLTVSGNLVINGTTTTVDSTTLTTKDPIITLGGGSAGTAASSDDNKDRGIEFKWHNGTSAKTGFFGFDDSTGYFTFIPDATNTSEVFSGTVGDIQAGVYRGTGINVTDAITESSATDQAITLNATDNSWKYIGFQWAGTRKSYFGINSSGAPEWGSDSGSAFQLVGSSSLSIGGNAALHAGNYNSYALPLTGGTLTGDLRFNIGGGYGRVAYADNYHGLVLRGYPNNAAGAITAGDVTCLIQHSGDFRFYRTNGTLNNLVFQVNNGVMTQSASGTVQHILNSTDSNSKEIVFQNNGSTVGYVWAASGYVGLGGGSTSTSLFVTSSGAVGIGTTGPSGKLDVSGNLYAGTGSADTNVYLRGYNSALSRFTTNTGSSGNYNGLRIDSNYTNANSLSNWFVDIGGNDVISRTGTSDTFNIGRKASGGSETTLLLLNSSGNLGIGTTSPSVKLHVAGSAIIANNTSINPDSYLNQVVAGAISTGGWGVSSAIGGSGNTGHAWAIGTNSTRLYFAYGDGASTNTLQSFIEVNTNRNITLMPTSGNVGIGTASPGYKLQVAGNGYFSSDLTSGGRISATGYTCELYLDSGASYSTITSYGSANYRDLWIRTLSSSSDGVWIKTSGNVGIGTASPSYKLDVAGDIRATANIYVSTGNTTGNGIVFADDGDIVDLNDGWCSHRFSYGLRIYSANKSGSSIIQLANSAGGNSYFNAANVGIGATTVSAKLEVATANDTTTGEPTAWDNKFFVVGTGNSSTAGGVFISYDQTNNRGYIGALTPGVAWRNLILQPSANGNVGIGTKTPGYKLEVNGSFAATTKSFVIKHPTKEGKKLRYGSLEGPENGVYVRGKLKGTNAIELPDYWTKLVDPESITVNLTPIGSHQKLYVEKIEDNVVYIANENLLSKGINCFYTVFGERIDVEKLQVEIDAS